MRDVTAQRVAQFSNVFHALPIVFQRWMNQPGEEESEREMDYFMSNVTEKTCQTCFKKDQCWTNNFNTTYDYMEEIIHEMDQNDGTVSPKLSREWEKHCITIKKSL